ncbi:hypothetical protein KSC_085900 [Ktedonobacter sp. SOSP1-52]|nr:hypothetical protein KSC_085900 [Ktedonobacter sp. SOSP1-52]
MVCNISVEEVQALLLEQSTLDERDTVRRKALILSLPPRNESGGPICGSFQSIVDFAKKKRHRSPHAHEAGFECGKKGYIRTLSWKGREMIRLKECTEFGVNEEALFCPFGGIGVSDNLIVEHNDRSNRQFPVF